MAVDRGQNTTVRKLAKEVETYRVLMWGRASRGLAWCLVPHVRERTFRANVGTREVVWPSGWVPLRSLQGGHSGLQRIRNVSRWNL